MPGSPTDALRSNVFLQVGARLWVPCERLVWRAGVVVGSDAGRVIVKVQNDSRHEHLVIDTEAAGPRGGPAYMLRTGELFSVEAAKAIEDLSLLPMLAEPEALHSLRMRYAGQNIYTFAGPMLLAVNPYQTIPGLYDNEQLDKFANLPQGCPPPSPHIFSIARDAYLGIQFGNMSQTVLVSGESGAGKTETAKLVIRFLALAGGRKPEPGEVTMEHRVLESVPLLEALGNARTLKNDNSSRFGKFIELRLHRAAGIFRPCIKDALTHTYLLETVRVTDLNEGERCFHIFYQVLAAAARARTLTDKVASDSCDVLTYCSNASSGKMSTEDAEEAVDDRPTFPSRSRTDSFGSATDSLCSVEKRTPSRQRALDMAAAVEEGKTFLSPDYLCDVSHIEWDQLKCYWVVTWTKHEKTRSKIFSPAKFLEPGMTSGDADAAARKAAIAFRHELVARGKLKVPPLPLNLAFPGLALPDYLDWSPEHFQLLSRSDFTVLPDVDEAANFDRTLEAMRALHIRADEMTQVISAVIAVLFLGNIQFQSITGNSEASEVTNADSLTGPLHVASMFLGVEKESLATALCTRELQVHGKSTKQVIRKCRTPPQAADCRDALARHLYGMVFAFIVSRVNDALSTTNASEHGNVDERTAMPTIGVLDIFGFEVFEQNCFEQLCINFANEVLQQHFTMVVFEHELALYEAEGILCDPDEVKAQAAIAQQRVSESGTLLSGAFALLDEECNVAGGTSDSWLYKVTMSMSYGNSSAFQVVHHRKGHFVIRHFAGPVEYCADAFLAKNRDTLSAEALACMQGSSRTVLQQQFSNHGRKFGTVESERSGRVLRARRHTVSADFRGELTSLMAKIRSTCSRFVRCIKPNQMGAAHSFDSFSVAEQLRYQGVLEAIRVARVGYAVKLSHAQAVMTYWALVPGSLRRQLEKQVRRGMNFEAAQALFVNLAEKFREIPVRGIQVGKTMTFFKQDAIDVLGIRVFECREGGALRVQTAWRAKRCARRFSAIRSATLKLQTHCRMRAARKLAATMRRERAAIRLQAAERGHQAGRAYRKNRRAVITLQAWWRGKKHRDAYKQIHRAVVRLQLWFRKRLDAIRLCKALASQSEAARRLKRIRAMVEETLSRIDTLDPAKVDSKNLVVSHAIKSLERTSCRLSRKAEVLDWQAREVLDWEPRTPMETDTERSTASAVPRMASWTPKKGQGTSNRLVPRTPERLRSGDIDHMSERVPQEQAINPPSTWGAQALPSRRPRSPRSEAAAWPNPWSFVSSLWQPVWQCTFCACDDGGKPVREDAIELRHPSASGPPLFSIFPEEGQGVASPVVVAAPVVPPRGPRSRERK